MKILITGAGGMVGRSLLSHPAAPACKILAPSKGELDLRNTTACGQYINGSKPDLIIHAAGLVGGIQANLRNPLRFLSDNLDMGRNVVMAAREAGVSRLINLGSSCMYPRNAPNPLSEENVFEGALETSNEGYALAKIVTARLCEYVSRTNGLNYKTLIPCNLYGPFDKFDPSVSHLVPAVIRKIHQAKLSGAKEVEIWGDGTARREYMYSEDLADGIWFCARNMERLPFLMNLGIGVDYSIADYYRATAHVIGWKGSFIYDESKPVGVYRKLTSIKVQNALGWRPRVSLNEGLRLTYKHFVDQVIPRA